MAGGPQTLYGGPGACSPSGKKEDEVEDNLDEDEGE